MKLLLKTALANKKHYCLYVFTLLGILGVTIASQMEILSLGVVVKTGPDFFLLFGKKNQQGYLTKTNSISYKDLNGRWKEIADQEENVSNEQVSLYLKKHTRISLTGRIKWFLQKRLNIEKSLVSLVCFLIVIALFKALMLFMNRFASQLITIRLSKELRENYFLKIKKLPMSFFYAYDMGSLSTRVTVDSFQMAASLNSILINYLRTPFAIVSTLGACVYISWQLSLLVFIGFPVFIFPVVFLSKKLKTAAKKLQKHQEGFTSIFLDFLSGIMTVKLFSSENFSFKKYKEENNKIAILEEKSACYLHMARPLLHTISSLFFAVVILIGLCVLSISYADLLVFCGMLYLVYEPVKKFADENGNIILGIAAAERMKEVLSYEEEKNFNSGLKFNGLKREIEFKNVSFSYDNQASIFKNINFKIKKGDAVAFVGATGTGKSTIAKLLSGLYEVTSGEILFDNTPLTMFNKSSLREHIGCISQHVFLFSDTILNNLTLGKEFSPEEVDLALKLACAKDFVSKLPLGKDVLIEEAGKNFSGGQQQRLALARAFLKKASILIFDEATSALDSISENHIKNTISQFKRHCTQIIITHKLSVLDCIDKIIYLEEGGKILEGTKQELIDTSPSFKLMWDFFVYKEKSKSS